MSSQKPSSTTKLSMKASSLAQEHCAQSCESAHATGLSYQYAWQPMALKNHGHTGLQCFDGDRRLRSGENRLTEHLAVSDHSAVQSWAVPAIFSAAATPGSFRESSRLVHAPLQEALDPPCTAFEALRRCTMSVLLKDGPFACPRSKTRHACSIFCSCMRQGLAIQHRYLLMAASMECWPQNISLLL